MARVLFQHPLMRGVGFPVQTRDGEREYLRLELGDWVNVVALTPDQQLVLVRQHRWGIEEPTLEVPGGGIDAGEDPEAAAQRELREETGYGGGRWTCMGWVWVNPALQTNRMWLYLAEDVTVVGGQELDPGEQDLEVLLRPGEETMGMVERGEIRHSLVVLGLLLWWVGRVQVLTPS